MDIENKIDLCKKFLSGSLTKSEQEEFNRLLEKNVRMQKLIERIKQNDGLSERIEFYRTINTEDDWKKIIRYCDFTDKASDKETNTNNNTNTNTNTGTSQNKNSRQIRNMARYAAAIVLLIAASWLLWQYSSDNRYDKGIDGTYEEENYRGNHVSLELASGERLVLGDTSDLKERLLDDAKFKEAKDGLLVNSNIQDKHEKKINKINVPRGKDYHIVLDDGTKVWINSDSYLLFPSVFEKQKRVVELYGEAFFEVKHDKNRPFYVKTDRGVVKVLGTAFNINTYDGNNVTTLVEGSVEFGFAGKTYRLDPGKQSSVENGQVSISDVNVKEYIAWKDGVFIFRNQRLENALTTLSRWYDLEVFYQNEEVKDLHFTGNIRRHSDIRKLLVFWEETGLIDFEMKGRTLIVRKK